MHLPRHHRHIRGHNINYRRHSDPEHLFGRRVVDGEENAEVRIPVDARAGLAEISVAFEAALPSRLSATVEVREGSGKGSSGDVGHIHVSSARF